MQFALARQTEPGRWRLAGLLRGRGGTEAAAFAAHLTGTEAILLDDAIVALDPALVPSEPGTTLAAIGLGDAEPEYALLANPGLARRPLVPVHPRCAEVGGALVLEWVRRARGAWSWADGVESPLVEERELYRVGLGPTDAPWAEWNTTVPSLTIEPAVHSALAAAHAGAPLWVRQVGRFAQSDPLLITRFA